MPLPSLLARDEIHKRLQIIFPPGAPFSAPLRPPTPVGKMRNRPNRYSQRS
jgi:hypothetical protein